MAVSTVGAVCIYGWNGGSEAAMEAKERSKRASLKFQP